MVVWAALLPGVLALAGACGGNPSSEGEENAVGSTASSGSGGAGGTSASGSNASGSTGGPNDLSGTWDVIVSEADGDTSTLTVTLSPTQLAVAGELDVLALVADEVIDVAYDDSAIRATRNVLDMDLGVIPLPLGGLLHFTGVPDEGPSCDYALDSERFTLVCTDDISTPGDLPELDSADLEAVHTEALESDFGEFGGRWSVSAEDVDCSVVFEGNTIQVDCARAGSDSGQASITVGTDRISGSTSEGVEFTAQRR